MMDDDENHSAYPDPSSAFVTPYSSQYASTNYLGNDGPYGDARTGGLWQAGPGPLIHDGFIPRDEISDGEDVDDEEDDLRGLYAKFNLGSILNNGSPFAQRGTNFFDTSAIDGGLDLGLDDDVFDSQFAPPDLDANVPEIDPDFEVSDAESEGAASVDSDLLDDIVNESAPVRGRGRGRPRGRGRGGGRGRRGWKWALKGTEHDPDREKRARGRPRGSRNVPRGEGRARGRPAGIRNTADPGEAFRRVQAQATQNYLAGDYETAAEFAREAVKMNPEVFAAHSLLSEVLQALGRAKDSLAVLIAGAHTKRDAELWVHVGQKTRDLAGDDPTPESLDAAVYCFSWAIRLNPEDFDARRERLNLLLQILHLSNDGHAASRARNECVMMLKLRPYDMLVARELAELATMSKNTIEIRKAKEYYDKAIELQPDISTLGPDPDEEEQWNHALVYVGMTESIEDNIEAIRQFKRLARWIQQRQDETFWDEYPNDDREFDFPNESRKLEVEQYRVKKESGRIEAQNDAPSLPLDMRIKLGLYRMSFGESGYEEALRHFEHLLAESDNVAELADLFREVGDTLKSEDEVEEAIKFYEPLQDVPDALDTAYYNDLAACYVKVGRMTEAEDCYKIVVESNPADWEARVALAKMYEAQDRRAEALPLITDVVRMGRHDALRKSQVTIPKKEIRAEQKKREQEAQQEAEAAQIAAISKEAEQAAQNSMVDQVILDLGTKEQLELRKELEHIGRKPAREKREAAPKRVRVTKTVPVKAPISKVRRVGPGRPRRIGISNAALQKQQKITEQIKTMKSAGERIHSNYEVVQSCEADMATGDEDAAALWKSAINGMLDEFKSCKFHFNNVKERHIGFYGYGRHTKLLNEMEAYRESLANGPLPLPSLPDEVIPDQFHDIPHSKWLDLFCSLSLQLAREGNHKACYENLDKALEVNLWHNDTTATNQIHATSLSCALLLNDDARITTNTRHFMTIAPHSPTSYDLFTSVFRLHSGPSSWFNASPTQKFLMRAVKSFDFHILPDAQRASWPFTSAERHNLTQGGKKAPGWPGIPDLSPNLLALYGHIMAATQTWTGALNYYFRALAMRPRDPTLLLCIGTAYVMGAMKRQSENRHWMVLQGLGFLGRYRRVRTRMVEEMGREVYRQEAEYNIARAWHFLGLTHLAIRGYRRCLALRVKLEKDREERGTGMDVDGREEDMDVEEYTQEAALGLINIYITTEQPARARSVAEKYLVI